MIRSITFLLLVILLSNKSNAQNFNDTIFTKNAEIIICNITLVNNYNIFYTSAKKKNKSVFIPRADVIRFTVSSKDVAVMKEEEAPKQEAPAGFKEENGIIFPADIELQPRFQRGQADMYSYLENHVRVRSQDLNIFGNASVIVCYRLLIDTSGKILNVLLEESSVSNQGFDMDARRLEEEIRLTIASMPAWQPARIRNESIAASIYLPLKFRLDMNRVMILPSKNLFIFKNRKN
jgi:hypothetical protein